MDDDSQQSSESVEAVDRGGLTRVNNITFELFWRMEKTLRNIMPTTPMRHIPDKCVEKIMSDEDVQFIWSMMSADWADPSAAALLKMIISEWMKIRGFSYTSAWVEKFKSEHRKTIQKTKGLRKQLQPMPPRAKKARIEECESD